MTTRLHDDELSVDLPLVRALVDRAFPAWSTLALSSLATSGSSNALFRLGEALLVRLPRQPGGSTTIEKEARWLSEIGPLIPVAVPEVVAVGDPALRWYRGEPLATRDAQARRGIAACRTIPGLDLDLDAALGVWEEAMTLPEVNQAVSPRWYHGDLLAENLLVRDGHIAAVLDFGGLGVGDPTIDLIAAWEVLDPAAREVLRTALDLDDVSWLRGRAWALTIAVMTFPYYWRTMPERCASRHAMASSVLADACQTRRRRR